MDVTYYVALPFVVADDGVAAGEAVECLSANAAVMRAEALSRKPGCAGAIAFSRTGDSGDRRIRRRQADPEIRRRAGRPERAVKPTTLRANARGRNAAFPSSRPALADRCRSRRDCRPTTRGRHHECSSVRRSPARPRR